MRSDAMTSGKCVRVRREGRREGREKGEGRKRGGENAWNSIEPAHAKLLGRNAGAAAAALDIAAHVERG